MDLRVLLSYARPYRLQLVIVAVLMLASSLVTLAVPWLIGQIGGLIIDRHAPSPASVVALLLLALALLAILSFAVSHISGNTSARILAELRLKIYEHLQSLPIGFHHAHRQGDTLALMTYEVARLSQFLTGTLVTAPPLLLTAAGAVFMMFRIDPELALIVPALVPAFYLVLKLIGRKLRGLAQAIQQAEADVVGVAGENLQMLAAIKSFAREDLEAERYQSKIAQAMALTLRQNRIVAVLSPLIGFIAGSAAVLLLVFAGRSLQEGNMTPAQLVSFLLYAALLTRPVGALANVYGQIQTVRGTMARLQRVLTEAPEAGYAAPSQLMAGRGEIRFEGVHFAYDGREPILSGLDLHIRPGETLALTGLNGAGKTTIVNLLLRFYEPDRGRISFDGQDTADLDVRSLRREIGVVPQRALLFHGTIRANIAYGRHGASDAEVETAARIAQAYDFIVQLPQGFDTQVGDHGVRLSGGQRQRISLARALLKQPAVLVFDEATSMYDEDGEAAFIEACAGALQERTVILITHRAASLALADRIVSIEGGEAAEVARRPSAGMPAA